MEGVDLSAHSGINEGEITYAQPPAGNPVPPTGNQPSPSSQGKRATFNDPSSVAHIVAQAAKATAEAIAEQQGFARSGMLLAHDVLALRALETVVRDAHVKMERERSKGERREVEVALYSYSSGYENSRSSDGGIHYVHYPPTGEGYENSRSSDGGIHYVHYPPTGEGASNSFTNSSLHMYDLQEIPASRK
ncbi:unnamed protein product [Ectocarpus sp. CCAP 1310/34]|nr:unnamed protein product [Ectocarpus sp. CCAP 1310/34]